MKKINEIDMLKPFKVICSSTDHTFIEGDIIWKSLNGDINCVQAAGTLSSDEGDHNTYDGLCEEDEGWEVIVSRGREVCRRKIEE